MKITHLSSPESPELRPYSTLRRPVEHQQQGIFVAEGEKVVRRLLESRLETLSILLTPQWFEAYRSLLQTQGEDLHVLVAQKDLVETIVGFHLHQGIMAVGKIPTPRSLSDAVSSAEHPHLFVAVDGLTNAENLGVLVRNCAAFGVQALLVGETSSSPYLRRAVRNSMGAVFRLPVVHLNNLAQALQEMRSTHCVRCVAAHPRAEAGVLHQATFSGDCCIVFGNEGGGISPDVLAVCDEPVTIAMRGGVDSLNVASASAVFLYEVQRQRTGTSNL